MRAWIERWLNAIAVSIRLFFRDIASNRKIDMTRIYVIYSYFYFLLNIVIH